MLIKARRPLPSRTGGRVNTTECIPRGQVDQDTDGSMAAQLSPSEFEVSLQEVTSQRDALLAGEKVPPESEVLSVLSSCEGLARRLVHLTGQGDIAETPPASSALLSLDGKKSKKTSSKTPTRPQFFQLASKQLSHISHGIVTAPHVHVTPAILKLYVETQTMLQSPETFPEVFRLYAHAPIPLEDTYPVEFKRQNPKRVKNAVPSETASLALQCAIDARQLLVAIDIIENTYATLAFVRLRTLRKASLPIGALTLAPVIIYSLAKRLADIQNTMDTDVAIKMACVGMFSYLAATVTTGFLAITTYNDQMDRVTWMPGVPLSERWLREEERAAFDKIAQAWGFKERWRRGEEEGPEWETLRDGCGEKGMILDKMSLMDDME